MCERDLGFEKDDGQTLLGAEVGPGSPAGPACRIRPSASGRQPVRTPWWTSGYLPRDLLEAGPSRLPPRVTAAELVAGGALDRNLSSTCGSSRPGAQAQDRLALAYAGLEAPQKSLLAASCLAGTFNVEDHPGAEPVLWYTLDSM